MSDIPQPPRDSNNDRHARMTRAVAFHEAGDIEEAAQLYQQVLSEHPRDFDAKHLLGVVALQQGRLDIAQQLIDAALSVNPTDASAMGNLGTSYLRDGRLELALQWFNLALQLQPDSHTALINVGTVLHNMDRHREAIPLLRKAHALDANSYLACNLLGACLLKGGEAREAVSLFDAATRTEPDNAEGWANFSAALNVIGQHVRAREYADRALMLQPESSAALSALGEAQVNQGKIAEAIESYRRGIAAASPSRQILLNFAHVLMASGLNEEAIEQLQRAVTLDSNNLTVRWAIAIAHLKPTYKDTADLETSRQQFANSIEEVATWYRHTQGIHEPFDAVGVSQPFYIAYQPYNNRKLLSRYGELCVEWMATLPTTVSNTTERSAAQPASAKVNNKIRVGIASAHVHEHSVWNAITKGWIDHIDVTQFDIYLFQLSPKSDEKTEKARRAVAHFENQPTSFTGWVAAIRAAELDVLIYPEIGMDPLTVRLASLRLAPVQAASWGHPETTGLPTMDLYISGDGLEPQAAADNYSETLVRLPNLGVYVEPLASAVSNLDLKSLNLPSNVPLLLCPGSPFKYTPLYDDVWVNIARQLKKTFLRRPNGGRLVFFRSRSQTMDSMLESRLRAAFAKARVNFDAHASIIPTLERAQYFGLMRRSALLLDTLGFSGFNTALQAIECDLPVLAFEGAFMRGRLASAIIRRLDLPELVATTQEEFIQKAVELSGDAMKLSKLRTAIIERRHILFHDEAPIRALEQHLTAAVERARLIAS